MSIEPIYLMLWRPLIFACLGLSIRAEVPRPLLGVDGTYLHGSPHAEPWQDSAWIKALKDLGADFLVFHTDPQPTPEDNARRLARFDAAMHAAGLRYMLNNEAANWNKQLILSPGINEYRHADGTHRWDYRMEWLRPLLDQKSPAMQGIVYDETEHMQLIGHQFATLPDGSPLDLPQIANTAGLSPEQSFTKLVEACRTLKAQQYEGRVRLATEQVWPDMFHVYAAGGWTITPKLLKENLSSVVMSIALGAALQYADSGTSLWVSPDLWCRGVYPGHSPAALGSALLMGYELGAEALYVENFDLAAWPTRHFDSDPEGSLVRKTPAAGFEFTRHGRAVRQFFRDYIPQHPRNNSWRDYQPRLAIIRLPDGAWGQQGTTFRDRLLGNPQHPMDKISAEWLHLWPILTHGTARPGAISLNHAAVYPEASLPFFVPIDSVAVFDHTVKGAVLDSVECFLVCGHALTRPTFEAISKRVAAGATVLMARRLYELHAKELPKLSRWHLIDDFKSPHVAVLLQPFLGSPEIARFRFKNTIIEFKSGKVPSDHLEVLHVQSR